ncbi:1-deoxy-d-xylulose 5-phosphate reductoisomerase [hydrocarbon metagenome]|uniref:1-deoxy-D-xylulose-5-phosphate reductoisomerase n=1 Tax=hydrocarbon metagenome TaxID=938273 RepID=A0A0W8E4T0_9ZZZZ
MTVYRKKNVVILGSTGSIGLQTLDVIEKHAGMFNLLGIAAKNEVPVLAEQIQRYRPAAVAVGDTSSYKELCSRIGKNCTVLSGLDGLCELAAWPEADIVVIAVSGAIGIKPTLAAIQSGKRVALANKETLVAAGDIVMQEARDNNAAILPVDSEHSAVFQCLQGESQHLKKIWLTASGGPFKDYEKTQLDSVTVEMALKHPNWIMGPKITIDSATLMNKGLEVIEAHHLFGINYDKIDVVVQKESIIHSLVELLDGSFLAHMGSHDMRIPIQYALTYPDRVVSSAPELDLKLLGALHFESPDMEKFPALALAYRAGRIGGTMPAVLNAANEIAVNRFLTREKSFTDIPGMVEKVMERHDPVQHPDLDGILQADEWARRICREL